MAKSKLSWLLKLRDRLRASWPARRWWLYRDRKWHIDYFKKLNCKFVRSQCQLAQDSERATGLRMTLADVLRIFGPDVLREIANYGSAIIDRDSEEPARTFRNRRLRLKMSASEVAQRAEISREEVLNAEDPSCCNSIHILVKIANVMGLNPDYISWKSGDPNNGWLY